MKSKYWLIMSLLLALILGSYLRIYKLTEVPPSLNWDEVSVGYNSWSIANFGIDEWGAKFPIAFKSFEEYKMPVHIYINAAFIKVFGLTDFMSRFPTAVFGILNILFIYFVGRFFFKSNLAGILASLLLAISPQAIHFSRFNHEANFTIFFFLLGLILFYKGLASRAFLMPFAFLSFGLSLISYNAAKIMVPILVVILILFYFNKLWKLRKQFIGGVIIFCIFIFLVITNPGLSGRNRAAQTSLPKEEVHTTTIYKSTGNELLGEIQAVGNRYISYFSPKYLIISGDNNPRLSWQASGQFYKIEIPLLVVGLIMLLIRKRRESVYILLWAILAPLPGSLFGGTGEIPHSGRALFMMGSWQLISGYGLLKIIEAVRMSTFKWVIGLGFVVIVIWSCISAFQAYLSTFSNDHPYDFQYGMKQIVTYLQKHSDYQKIYMTDIRSQPYIFFLYYLKYPTNKFLETVKYNDGSNRSSNLVLSFDKYNFGNWDPIESKPEHGILYIIGPSHFDGLRYKDKFDIKKIVRYPDGSEAFYIVSASY